VKIIPPKNIDLMKNSFLRFVFFLFTATLFSQVSNTVVVVVNNENGHRLVVNGKDFIINGMNWDYIPIGTNTLNANFWNKPDEDIKAGLLKEMSLLKNMNVNAIRQYTGIPARWIQYIYENFGIHTMLNDSFGRYGYTLNGVYTAVTDYSDPKTQKHLLEEIEKLVKEYKNTPGLLLYLLGNENNYGLFWAGAETEDFPDEEEQKLAVGETRGRPMYRLMNEAAKRIKTLDASHPVAICNGDTLFIDIIAEECSDVDIFGVNAYRGISFTDMYAEVKEKLNKPVMLTEFGADAFNAITNKEDQKSQAHYMLWNWKEIYENAAGLGKAENSIGGFTFQFSDGWWKVGFNNRIDADTHQTDATWSGGGYAIDIAYPGANNMNEEWFGIAAKGPANERGLYDLYPRAAYYVLKEAHQLNPYKQGLNLASLEDYFSKINILAAMRKGGVVPSLEADKEPTHAPMTPPKRLAKNVISIYGEGYGPAIGLKNVDWDNGSEYIEEVLVNNKLLKVTFNDFIGMSLQRTVDVSNMTHFHMDIWIADDYHSGQVFNPRWTNQVRKGGAMNSFQFLNTLDVKGNKKWTSIDVPISNFEGDNTRANLREFLITVSGRIENAYIDNIYFYKK